MSDAEFPLTQRFLSEIWTGMGGETSWIDSIEFSDAVQIKSPFGCTDLAAAAFGACGAAVAELTSLAGPTPTSIQVSRAMASEWFRFPPIAPSRPLVNPPGFGKPVVADDRSSVFAGAGAGQNTGPAVWANVYPTADDRWILLRGGGEKALKALGVKEDYEEVAAVIKSGKADEIEQAVVDAGGIIAANHTIEEWLDHPQGQAVGAEPIVTFEHTTPFAGENWAPTPGRPLAGIRVLDVTRVLAGPLGTRFLAACGAEVLRIDAPDAEEIERSRFFGDAALGKRMAFVDLRTPEGKEQFLALLSQADILVHGYRPGGIDSLVDPALRAETRPGLIEVQLDAYGWTGPWKMRRGYDTVTQWSTGLADGTTAWALEDPENRIPINAIGRLVDASRPRHMPIEALDFGTGHQIAAATIRALTRRLQTGLGSRSRLSLARTAAILINGGRVPELPYVDFPLDGPYEDRLFTVNGKPTRRLKWPLEVQGNPFYWEHQGDKAGASSPIWSTI
ncbi:MAG: CoA transferase [Actinobacteria bacterium]|nr:CoA transferase [Actinomycetota bacterium]